MDLYADDLIYESTELEDAIETLTDASQLDVIVEYLASICVIDVPSSAEE
jgi:hypothetical protein